MFNTPSLHGEALVRAKAYAAKVGGIFDQSDDTGLIHVVRRDDGSLKVYQEPRSGTSGAILDIFRPLIAIMPSLSNCHSLVCLRPADWEG